MKSDILVDAKIIGRKGCLLLRFGAFYGAINHFAFNAK